MVTHPRQHLQKCAATWRIIGTCENRLVSIVFVKGGQRPVFCSSLGDGLHKSRDLCLGSDRRHTHRKGSQTNGQQPANTI
jgi:hypothetical protein